MFIFEQSLIWTTLIESKPYIKYLSIHLASQNEYSIAYYSKETKKITKQKIIKILQNCIQQLMSKLQH